MEFLRSLKNPFETFEHEAKSKQKALNTTIKEISIKEDQSTIEMQEAHYSEKEKFKVETCLRIIDWLCQALSSRIEALRMSNHYLVSLSLFKQ